MVADMANPVLPAAKGEPPEILDRVAMVVRMGAHQNAIFPLSVQAVTWVLPVQPGSMAQVVRTDMMATTMVAPRT